MSRSFLKNQFKTNLAKSFPDRKRLEIKQKKLQKLSQNQRGLEKILVFSYKQVLFYIKSLQRK